jgi:DNA-directed RNA polymerase subunit H (RpoH/RPB5)
MEVLYEKYQNIILCFGPKYRKCQLLDNVLDFKTFEKNMGVDKFIVQLMFDPTDAKFIYVVLFHHQSIHLSKTDMFKKFLDVLASRYHKNDESRKQKFLSESKDIEKSSTDIMAYDRTHIESTFITKHELKSFFLKSIDGKNKKSSFIVHNYMHRMFLLEIPRAPLCGKHTVLTKQEARELCSEHLMTSKFKLPAIQLNDPQVIWCGGRSGDIIKIEANSELCGRSIRYRLVKTAGGKAQGNEYSDEEDESDDEVNTHSEANDQSDAEEVDEVDEVEEVEVEEAF